jgi:hypothetical protein
MALPFCAVSDVNRLFAGQPTVCEGLPSLLDYPLPTVLVAAGFCYLQRVICSIEG